MLGRLQSDEISQTPIRHSRQVTCPKSPNLKGITKPISLQNLVFSQCTSLRSCAGKKLGRNWEDVLKRSHESPGENVQLLPAARQPRLCGSWSPDGPSPRTKDLNAKARFLCFFRELSKNAKGHASHR